MSHVTCHCFDVKVILETDRLLLREYVEEDAEAFFKLNNNPEVSRFVPDKPLFNVDQARQILVAHPIADYRKHGFGRGACILKSTGEQIGMAGLKYLEELGEVDVAYRFLPAHWGLGFATEAALASVRFGFAELDLKRIVGLVMPENIASAAGAGKNGAALCRDGDVLGPPVLKVRYNTVDPIPCHAVASAKADPNAVRSP